MTDQAEKLKQPKETALDSKVRKASEVETQEAGLHNEENKKIHDQAQARHKIGNSVTDLMIPNQAQQGAALEMVDEEGGYVLTGKGYKPLVPEDISKSFGEKLRAIPEVQDPALLPDKVADATIEYWQSKGMIPDSSTSLEDLQEQCSYNADDPNNGSDSLPAMTEDEATYYRVHKSPGHAMLEGGIQERHKVEEPPPTNFMAALSPEMQAGVIAAFQKGGQVGQQAIHETTDDILRKTAEGYIDTIKAPIDVAIAAGKGLWGILEFERDLITNPERAQQTAATAGDYIGKALVAGIKLWGAGSEYASDVQQKGDYGRPFQDLGNAINKWYDGLTPGDQMHVMASISAGFGIGAAAGQLKQLAKPGAFVEFMEEAAHAVPKNPEAQEKAAQTIRDIIQSFSKPKLKPVLETGMAEPGGSELGSQIDRASKALKDKFEELHHKMTAHKPEGGKGKWEAGREAREADIPAARSLDNIQTRDWYNARVAEIYDFEQQMKDAGKSSREIFDQVFELRNKAKQQAGDLMKDRVKAEELDRDFPLPTREEVLGRYGNDYDKAIAASKRTNADINQQIEQLRKRKD